MEITLEEIQNKFEKLPEDLKWAIMAADINKNITLIGQKHGLNIEQLGQLSLETHMVVLGYTDPNKFEESLKLVFNFPNDKNKELVKEINEIILKEIREKLMSLKRRDDNYLEKIEDAPIQESVINNHLENINREEAEGAIDEKEIQNKKIMDSIVFKKLSDSFNTPIKKTEYALPNISKDGEKTKTYADQNVKISRSGDDRLKTNTENNSDSYTTKEDPYRMKPE